jgi:hypothetical protein
MKNQLGDGWSPEVINYTRNVISIGIGYKIGLFDRPPRKEKSNDTPQTEE